MSKMKSRKIEIRRESELEIMRKAGEVLRKVFVELKQKIKPGLSTGEIDKFVENFIRSHDGMFPAFKGYKGFPFSICASIDDEVVHGFPSFDRILKEGEIFKVDCGVKFDGWNTDACRTFEIGEISLEKKKLMKVTKEALKKAVKIAKDGVKTGDIGNLIQKTVEKAGYSAVEECVGHGIGKQVHEAPYVPNFGKKGTGVKLRKNMTICIEPIINIGKKQVYTVENGWCIMTKDGLPSAHFEHTICIGKDSGIVIV